MTPRTISESDLHALIDKHKRAAVQPCNVLLLVRPNAVASDLYDRMIDDKDVPCRVVAEIIQETTNVKVGVFVIDRHRRHECLACAQ